MDRDRRTFLKAGAAATAFFPASVLGANDKIRVALIGAGARGAAMGDYAREYPNAVVVASCDVDKTRREAFAKKGGAECEVYGDYRKVLDRKDIDGVIVATPDHWHSPITVAALEAGKHVYVEKPLSNTVDAAAKMLTAAERYKKVVQVGTMQRSAAHFQEFVKLIQTGGIGPITQVVVVDPPGGSPDRKMNTAAQPIPEGFDWEMWQGPAPRHDYTPSRARSWRSWYDYGGGSLTDWGIHHVDIVHMALDPDGNNPPLQVFGSGYYPFLNDPDPDAVPGTWAVTVQYANFTMSILSCTPALTGNLIQGPIFWGSKGQGIVNRSGYGVQPASYYNGYATRLGVRNKIGAPVELFEFVKMRAGQGQSIEAKEFLLEKFSQVQADWERGHVFNWLDCIKSGAKPIADIASCFNGHLTCLMAVESIKSGGRALQWDATTRTAKPA